MLYCSDAIPPILQLGLDLQSVDHFVTVSHNWCGRSILLRQKALRDRLHSLRGTNASMRCPCRGYADDLAGVYNRHSSPHDPGWLVAMHNGGRERNRGRWNSTQHPSQEGDKASCGCGNFRQRYLRRSGGGGDR